MSWSTHDQWQYTTSNISGWSTHHANVKLRENLELVCLDDCQKYLGWYGKWRSWFMDGEREKQSFIQLIYLQSPSLCSHHFNVSCPLRAFVPSKHTRFSFSIDCFILFCVALWTSWLKTAWYEYKTESVVVFFWIIYEDVHALRKRIVSFLIANFRVRTFNLFTATCW
jgi:hypothetical protein